MINLIFYTEPKWAFGSIHYELCKYLWPYGINAQLLPWSLEHNRTELEQLFDTIDCIVTNAGGIAYLRDLWGISIADKAIVIVHGLSELDFILEKQINIFACKGYYVVSDYLIEKSIERGIIRQPKKIKLRYKFF